jgi:hypothetical protein
LKWYCPPGCWTNKKEPPKDDGKDGWWKVDDDDDFNVLWLAPPAKRDFWRKTYYQPLLVKDDGPFLYRTVSRMELPIMVQVSFEITNPTSQFDQGGIMIRLDHDHWIKTGIEVVDGIPRLSCVVTNGFSDWSTQPVPNHHPAMTMRVHVLPQQGGSIVVEAAPIGSDQWSFIRIGHLNQGMNHDLFHDTPDVLNAFQGIAAPTDTILCGLFGACPVDQEGMVVKFYDFSIRQGSTFVHDA